MHYRESDADAAATVADCQKIAIAGARIDSFQADLGDESQARALLPRVVERFGAVDAYDETVVVPSGLVGALVIAAARVRSARTAHQEAAPAAVRTGADDRESSAVAAD